MTAIHVDVGSTGASALVVDAFVETMGDNQSTWNRTHDPRLRGFDQGPWSTPHAIEIGRAWRCLLIENRLAGQAHVDDCLHGHGYRRAVRVIDTAGVVVEQWPKPKS